MRPPARPGTAVAASPAQPLAPPGLDGADGEPPQRGRAGLPPPEEVVDHFPHKVFREGQREALIEAARSLSQRRSVQFEAPVGSGKSPIAIALARWAGGAVITTPLNTLVDQYARDYGKLAGVAVVKGRDHYPCERTGGTAATAPCTYNREARRSCACPFRRARDGAINKEVVVTSMAMAMTAPWLPEKPLVIVDEAHGLESAVARQVRLEFREEDFRLPPEDATFGDHLTWLEGALAQARRKVEALDEEIEIGEERAKTGLSWVPPTVVKERDKWKGLVLRIAEMLLDHKVHGEPWVVQRHASFGGAQRLAYLPVTGTRFVQGKLLSKGGLAVLLTATPPPASEVGLGGRAQRIVLPMRWPRERRPVVLDYRGNMGRATRDAALPQVALGIADHASGRTIVHAHAYEVARALSGELKRLGVGHVLQDPEDREKSLQAWMRGREDVFLSVRMNEGLDLRGDLCRTQLLAKVPWPGLGDAWVQARRELMGDAWMAREVARSITQAYGRAVRAESDWADFVILDQGFELFYKRNRDLFPAWFQEAVGLPKVGGGNTLRAFG